MPFKQPELVRPHSCVRSKPTARANQLGHGPCGSGPCRLGRPKADSITRNLTRSDLSGLKAPIGTVPTSGADLLDANLSNCEIMSSPYNLRMAVLLGASLAGAFISRFGPYGRQTRARESELILDFQVRSSMGRILYGIT